jgi:hypothetical protein
MKKIFWAIILLIICLGGLKVTNADQTITVTPSSSDQNVNFSWSEVPNTTNYQIILDGSLLKQVSGTVLNYTCPPSTCGTGTHTVQVVALDSSNKQIASGTQTFTRDSSGNITVTTPTTNGGSSLKDIIPKSNYSDLNKLMLDIANRLIEICAGLALIAVVYSGIMYITAGGDTAKAETARKNLTWAITGVVVAILAGVIVTIVNNALTG